MGTQEHEGQQLGEDTAQQPTADELAQRNADLRDQLERENASLEDQLTKSRAAGVEADGLDDEAVRRLEHPEEFAN